jgi:hypothetical protein
MKPPCLPGKNLKVSREKHEKNYIEKPDAQIYGFSM